MGSLVPTAVAAHALGVTPDAIRLLRHRGKLTRHGTKQRALVDIDELTELAAGRRSKTKEHLPMQLDGRHPGTTSIAKHFTFSHLPESLQEISWPCHDLAEAMIDALPDGPELTAGLRKLLEAKDCFVRAAID